MIKIATFGPKYPRFTVCVNQYYYNSITRALPLRLQLTSPFMDLKGKFLAGAVLVVV